MLRRAALVTFALALLVVAACGREITPEPSTNGNLAGHLDIRFRVNGMLAFSNYVYQIAIDACGGGAPLPNPGTTSTVKNYTYSFNVGAAIYGISAIATPVLFQYKLLTGLTGFTPLQIQIDPSYVSFNPNSNPETGGEFELIFDREVLDNPERLAQPCPNFTEPPSSAVRAADASPGGAPLLAVAEAATAAPSASPTAAGATPTPLSLPTTPAQSTWILNFIVLTPGNVALDSLGQGGPNDNGYGGIVVDTQTQEDIPVNKQPDTSGAPTDAAAQIAGGEVDNYP